METRAGLLARLGEKTASWVILALVVFLGITIYQMPAETKAAIWSGIWRTNVWLLIVAAVPWSARLYITRVLEAGSNWAGVVLIASLVAVDILVAVLLMSAWPAGAWSWFACLGALAVAGTYNYLVTEYLAEMAGG